MFYKKFRYACYAIDNKIFLLEKVFKFPLHFGTIMKFFRSLKSSYNSNPPPHNLDQVSILGRALYISGWVPDLQAGLRLDGKKIPFLVERVNRPDVASCFNNPDAANWGFILVAMLPGGHLDRKKLVLQLRPDLILTDPADCRHALEDEPAIAMINNFIASVHETKGSLLEIGSRARSGNSYRSLFPDDINYIGLDITAGPNVDIVGDVHSMSDVIEQQFDYIFSISVFDADFFCGCRPLCKSFLTHIDV